MTPDGDLRVVVVGSGRVGLASAHMLDDRGHDVVIIERNLERVEAAGDAYVATVIEGDATRPSVLEQADLDRTDAVAALTNTMGTNVAVCSLARELDPSIRTVMRTVYPDKEEFEDYADRVVFPEAAGARVCVNALEGELRSLEHLAGDVEILEIEVASQAPVANRRLEEVSLPEGSLVVSAAKGGSIATANTELEPGHRYLVATEPAVSDEVRQLFLG